jgi:hypothetical protein
MIGVHSGVKAAKQQLLGVVHFFYKERFIT